MKSTKIFSFVALIFHILYYIKFRQQLWLDMNKHSFSYSQKWSFPFFCFHMSSYTFLSSLWYANVYIFPSRQWLGSNFSSFYTLIELCWHLLVFFLSTFSGINQINILLKQLESLLKNVKKFLNMDIFIFISN